MTRPTTRRPKPPSFPEPADHDPAIRDALSPDASRDLRAGVGAGHRTRGARGPAAGHRGARPGGDTGAMVGPGRWRRAAAIARRPGARESHRAARDARRTWPWPSAPRPRRRRSRPRACSATRCRQSAACRRQMDNVALARALEQYAAAADRPLRAQVIEDYLGAAPQSPWRASVALNLGTVLWREGYFTRAARYWTDAWELAKGADGHARPSAGRHRDCGTRDASDDVRAARRARLAAARGRRTTDAWGRRRQGGRGSPGGVGAARPPRERHLLGAGGAACPHREDRRAEQRERASHWRLRGHACRHDAGRLCSSWRAAQGCGWRCAMWPDRRNCRCRPWCTSRANTIPPSSNGKTARTCCGIWPWAAR